MYASLRQQLRERQLEDLVLRDGVPTHPFVWEQAASDDFYFEDSMRLVREALRCQPVDPRRSVCILAHLQQNTYVKSLQRTPALPSSLRAAFLRAQAEKSLVMFVRNLQRTKYMVSRAGCMAPSGGPCH